MPAVVRKGDLCSGHGAHPPRISDSGSGNVFINGKEAHRLLDTWVAHSKPVGDPETHTGIANTGSGTVFVNGRPLCRVGDAIIKLAGDGECTSIMAQGSPNVFTG